MELNRSTICFIPHPHIIMQLEDTFPTDRDIQEDSLRPHRGPRFGMQIFVKGPPASSRLHWRVARGLPSPFMKALNPHLILALLSRTPLYFNELTRTVTPWWTTISAIGKEILAAFLHRHRQFPQSALSLWRPAASLLQVGYFPGP